MSEPDTLINSGIVIDDPKVQRAKVRARIRDMELALMSPESLKALQDDYLALAREIERYFALEDNQ